MLKKVVLAGIAAIGMSVALVAGSAVAAPPPMMMHGHMGPIHGPMISHRGPHKVCGWQRVHHHRVWVCQWVRW